MRKISIIITALFFILVSCQNGDTNNEEKNPFVGAWEDRDDYVIEQFIFTKEFEVTRTVQALSPENSGEYNETNIGTYEYDDAIIYFDYVNPNSIHVRAAYLIKDNKLTLVFSTSRIYTYTKIK